LIDYVAAFAGNTWEVFAVRVWFVAYLAWLLRLPGNHIPLPPLGLVSGLASLAGVPVSMVLAATASGSIWIVLPLLLLVQITSFAAVGALAGAGREQKSSLEASKVRSWPQNPRESGECRLK